MEKVEKPTLEEAINKIVEEAQSLEEFQDNLKKEVIDKIFICLIEEQKKTPFKDKDINLKPVKGLDLLVATFWNEKFSEGRIMGFLPTDKEKSFKNLADLNLQVFGRGTTLNERLLSFAEKHPDEDYVQLRIDIKEDDLLKCEVDDGKATIEIEIGEKIWSKLRNIVEEKNFKDFRDSVLNEPKQISDGARTIRHVFGAELRKERLNAVVDNWIGYFSGKEKSFFKLIYGLTPLEEILRYRKNQDFISEEEEKKLLELLSNGSVTFDDFKSVLVEGKENTEIKISKLSLGLDFELIDKFISFLQALAHFYPEAKTILGICKAKKNKEEGNLFPNYGRAVNLISQKHLDIYDSAIKQIMMVTKTIEKETRLNLYNLLETLAKEEEEMKEKKSKNKNKYQDKFQIALDDDPELDKDLKNKIENKLKEFFGLQYLLNVVGLLSSKVHEGRRLLFTFLYGGGTSWRVVEEILSEEENGNYQKEIASPEDFAKIIEMHWSIFQGERVAGFIDANAKKKQSSNEEINIPFTKIVKLKPYHNLPGLLFKKCVEFSHDSLIVYTSGNGIVRVFSYDDDDDDKKNNNKKKKRGIELFRWNTVNNKIEQASLEIDKITDYILELILPGGKS